MAIEEVIVAALTGAVSAGVYTIDVPEKAAMPFVVVRRVSYNPVHTLSGTVVVVNSVFAIDCWAKTKAGAISLKAAVEAALDAAVTLPIKSRAPTDAPDYEPDIQAHVEVAQYSIWHN